MCGIERDLFTVNVQLEKDGCCVVLIGDCDRGKPYRLCNKGFSDTPDLLQYTAMAVNWQEERTEVERLRAGKNHVGFPTESVEA